MLNFLKNLFSRNKKYTQYGVVTTSKGFIRDLKFAYAETYSFQRGEAYESTNKSFKEEYERLTRRNEKRNNLTNEEKERLAFLEKHCRFLYGLINKDGELHYSAQKTNTFQADSIEIQQLKEILEMPIQAEPATMCAPFYRDAIIFYDKMGNIVTVLNICLSCDHLFAEPFAHISADYATYYALRHFFINIGHDIEKNNGNTNDDMEEMQEKVRVMLTKKK